MTLARSILLLDSAPTAATVERYVTMLLAECEQIAHTEKGDRKASTTAPTQKPKFNEAKVKKTEEGEEKNGKGEGKGRDAKAPPCRYFLSDEGCSKGTECGFTHTLDGEKRCWNRGSESHFANACNPLPKEDGGRALKALQKTAEKERPPSSSTGKS
eukprot:s3094_g11.t1